MRRLSNREKLDIRSIRYFIPRRNVQKGWRIRDYDKVKMADLSSRGIRPARLTKGFELLRFGKTYREYQISSWRDDIVKGLITQEEIISELPHWLRPSIAQSLEGVRPSDEAGRFRFLAGRAENNRKRG